MNIEMTKRTILNSYMAAYQGHAPKKSWLLESKHGMGKSQVIAQLACTLSTMLKKPFGFIDLRLGQYEIGDLIGLQRIRDTFEISSKIYSDGKLVDEKTVATNVAAHDLPLWFPRDQEWCGFIFFDEIDRGSRDTQQWAFQAVLDYRVNFVDFSKGTMVLAARNGNQDIYSTLNLDPALYDRFGVIKFKPTNTEWRKHAESIGVHDAVLKYIDKFGITDLDPPEKIEPDVRYPSRRSWVSLSDEIKGFASTGDDPMNDNDYLFFLAQSWVGESVALNFKEFIAKDYKVYTPKEILDNFPKHQEAFAKMIATDITFYNNQIVDWIKREGVKLSKKQSTNLFSYVKTIPPETAQGFWRYFGENCKKQSADWYNSDPTIFTFIQGLYEKPVA